MPELPEVETTRRGIADLIRGLQIESVEVRRPKLRLPIPEDLAIRLEGAQWQETRRRANFLLLDSTAGTILVHLGMSGSLRLTDPTHEYRKHDHIIGILRIVTITIRADLDRDQRRWTESCIPDRRSGPRADRWHYHDRPAEHLWQPSRGKKRLRDYLLDLPSLPDQYLRQ